MKAKVCHKPVWSPQRFCNLVHVTLIEGRSDLARRDLPHDATLPSLDQVHNVDLYTMSIA